MRTLRITLVPLLFVVLLLAACRRPVTQTVPFGEQTLKGVVKPAALSLTRRGTHLLVVEGAPLVYLESTAVNLRPYEGRETEIEGTVEPNTDAKDLPVLVVKKVTGAPTAVSRTWTIPLLGVSLDVPREWRGQIIGESAVFLGSGSTTPILTVFLEGEGELMSPASSVSTDVTIRTFSLGSRGGVVLRNTVTGNERVQLDLRPMITDPARDVLTLLFTPAGEQEMDSDTWSAVIQDVVRSLRFAADASSSSVLSTSSGSDLPPLSGSGAGMPCGGEAGILCPTGMFCEITDAAANVGRCRGVR